MRYYMYDLDIHDVMILSSYNAEIGSGVISLC